MLTPSRKSDVQGFLAVFRGDEGVSCARWDFNFKGRPTRPEQPQFAGSTSSPATRILVAVDDGEPARWAARVAERLAKAVDAEVVLLHVIDPVSSIPPEMAATWEIERIRSAMRQRGDELLAAARVRVDPTLRVEPLVREGAAGDEIVGAAREWEATLVVMGTRGRGRLASFLLGSTADEVIRRAHCPVVTVGHDPDAVPTGDVPAREHQAVRDEVLAGR
jgi:nucleotide-binding universal stress UspA family protein